MCKKQERDKHPWNKKERDRKGTRRNRKGNEKGKKRQQQQQEREWSTREGQKTKDRQTENDRK